MKTSLWKISWVNKLDSDCYVYRAAAVTGICMVQEDFDSLWDGSKWGLLCEGGLTIELWKCSWHLGVFFLFDFFFFLNSQQRDVSNVFASTERKFSAIAWFQGKDRYSHHILSGDVLRESLTAFFHATVCYTAARPRWSQ